MGFQLQEQVSQAAWRPMDKGMPAYRIWGNTQPCPELRSLPESQSVCQIGQQDDTARIIARDDPTLRLPVQGKTTVRTSTEPSHNEHPKLRCDGVSDARKCVRRRPLRTLNRYTRLVIASFSKRSRPSPTLPDTPYHLQDTLDL